MSVRYERHELGVSLGLYPTFALEIQFSTSCATFKGVDGAGLHAVAYCNLCGCF